MKAVDERISIAQLLPKVNPAAEANKAREAAAKKKSEEMLVRRARLQRLQARRARMGGEDVEELEVDADDDVAEADEELTGDAIAAELAKLEEMLLVLARGNVGGAEAAAAAAGIEIDAPVTGPAA